MNPTIVGFIGIIILLMFIFLGVHIGIAMALVGFLGVLAIAGATTAFSAISVVIFGTINDFNFAVLALFMVMSEFISAAGIGTEAFDFARKWIGHIRGGLAMAAIGACGLFAATSGSSTACAMVMGKIAFPEMKRLGYAESLASGCIAAGGTLGIMIPPSMAFVIIGILTDTSIGKLFIAGFIPGITQILFYFLTILIMCRFNLKLGPAAPSFPLKQKVESIALTWPIIILFLLVLGGIYMGIFTPTEAAAIGAIGALLIGMVRRKLTKSAFIESLSNSVTLSGIMVLMLVSAFVFNHFLAITRMPFIVGEYIAQLGINRYFILAIILVVYVILGMFFDIFAVLMLTLPIIFPTAVSLGFDPIWYGVLMCRVAEMGLITPPFGMNVFVLGGVLKVPLSTIFRGVMPFIIADCFHVVFLILFPQVSLFLPSIMR